MTTESTFFKLAFTAVAYFSPVSSLVHLVLIFIAIDFATAMYNCWKNKVKIESNKLRKTVEKFVLYSIAILLAWGFQQEVAQWSNLCQVVSGFIAATELISIYENIGKITGLDLLSAVRDIINSKLGKR